MDSVSAVVDVYMYIRGRAIVTTDETQRISQATKGAPSHSAVVYDEWF